jgi:hypothetical protein
MSPAQLGYGTQSLTVFVDDVDEHHAQTATICNASKDVSSRRRFGKYVKAAL